MNRTETYIRASCPLCGDVDLPDSRFTLYIHPDPKLSVYVFACSDCGDEVRKPAPKMVVDLFSIAPSVNRVVLPAEITEKHEGSPFTRDDLIDFHLTLSATDMITELVT